MKERLELWAVSNRGSKYPFIWGILTSGITAAFVTTAIYITARHSMVFDDAINEFTPYLAEMSRLWTSGQLPLLTSHVVNGSSFLINFERSPFHPLIVGLAFLYAAIPRVFVIAVIFYFVSASLVGIAAWALARAFKMPLFPSVLVCVTSTVLPLPVYLYYGNWWNAALGQSAVLLFAAALRYQFDCPGRWQAFVSLWAATLNLFLIGWPQGYLVAVVLTGFWAWACMRSSHSFLDALKRMRWGVAAAVLAGLVVLPLFSQFLASSGSADRSKGILNDNFGVPALSQLFQLWSPVGGDFWNIWGGYRWWPIAIGYATPLVLLLPLVHGWGRIVKDQKVQLLGGVTIALALMTQLPSNLGAFQYPFRYLTYYSTGIVVLCVYILSRYRAQTSPRRMAIPSVAILVGTGYGLSRLQITPPKAPSLSFFIGVLILSAIVLLIVVWGFGHVGLKASCIGLLVAGVGLSLLQGAGGLGTVWLGPSQVPDYKAVAERLASFPKGYIVTVSNNPSEPWNPDLLPYMGSARYLTTGYLLFNGYDPVGFKRYNSLLKPSTVQGDLTVDSLSVLTKSASEFPSICRLNLYGVRSVVVSGDHLDAQLQASLSRCGFSLQERGATTEIWFDEVHGIVRSTVGYVTPGVGVVLQQSSDTSVSIRVRNHGGDGRIVFSRLDWPGYTVYKNGERARIRRADGLLTSVTIPRGFNGVVSLQYWPPWWGVLLPISALALIGTVLMAVLIARSESERRRSSEVDERVPGAGLDR